MFDFDFVNSKACAFAVALEKIGYILLLAGIQPRTWLSYESIHTSFVLYIYVYTVHKAYGIMVIHP